MNYALNLAEDGRVLSATFPQYAPADAVLVEELPEGNLLDYRYVDGQFVYDPCPGYMGPIDEELEIQEEETISDLDRIEAQVTYTAIITDTLLEV